MSPANNFNGPAIAFLALAIFFLILLVFVWIRYLVWWNSPVGRHRCCDEAKAEGRHPDMSRRPYERNVVGRGEPRSVRSPHRRSPSSSNSMGLWTPMKHPVERPMRHHSDFGSGAGVRSGRDVLPDEDSSEEKTKDISRDLEMDVRDGMLGKRKETSPVREYHTQRGSQHSGHEAVQQHSGTRGEPPKERSEAYIRSDSLTDFPGGSHVGGRRVAFAESETESEYKNDGRARERRSKEQKTFDRYADDTRDDCRRSSDSTASIRHEDRQRDRQDSRHNFRASGRSPIRSV